MRVRVSGGGGKRGEIEGGGRWLGGLGNWGL